MRQIPTPPLVAALLLGAVLAGELISSSSGQPPVSPPPARQLQLAPTVARTAADSHALAANAIERPLFSPSRRRDRPAPVAAALPRPPLPRLSGILIGHTSRVAVFASPGGNGQTAVPEGGTLGGVRVLAIAADRVTVADADGSHALLPSFDRTAPVAGPSQSTVLNVDASATAALFPSGVAHQPPPPMPAPPADM